MTKLELELAPVAARPPEKPRADVPVGVRRVAVVVSALPTEKGSQRFVEPLYLPSPDFFFNDTATTEIYTLSLHDALPISPAMVTVSSAWLPLQSPAL